MTVKSSEIARFVGVDLKGDDRDVIPEHISYSVDGVRFGNGAEILCERPRLTFGRILRRFFPPQDNIATTNHGHLAYRYVTIGKRCVIKPGAVIGYQGFGFERNEDGIPERIPHIGGVVIGDDVEIGANSVVARGTVKNTVIAEHAKLDDHVFVAHNAIVGFATMIAAGAVICGSAVIGPYCWIGAGALIKEHVSVDAYSLIGMGAVVTKDVPENSVMVGNPAKRIRDNT